MSAAAAIVLACAAVLGLAWFAATRNGRRLLYVTAVAVHRLFAPAEGEHADDPPAGVLAVLREITLAAAYAVRGCLHWPAGEMPRTETPRAPAAASAPGEGTVPAAPGAVPHTAPQPALTEPPNPAPNWAPLVTWTPYEASVPEMLP